MELVNWDFIFILKTYSRCQIKLSGQAITHPLFSFLSELGYEDSYKLQKVTVAICIIVIPMIAMVVCFGDLMLELLMGPLWSEFGRNFKY